MSHPWQFYAKVASACFVAGGCMELFMIKTGFYDKVTQLEAERLEETREQREEFQRTLRAELERQAREKNVQLHLPEK
ncbi:hypothetical protein WJX72_006590 [[Myrmecia] bisecta]|uniref:Uncharacterized protein n=1 Tax=[Myrmecia] bisecta TaxID=41462 RepID=A0AAW1PLU8_9CHLO